MKKTFPPHIFYMRLCFDAMFGSHAISRPCNKQQKKNNKVLPALFF